jgi:ribonuclease HI
MSSRSTPPGLFSDSPARSSQTSPGNGWITAHCDGGARGNPGPAGYGAEVTGPDGAVIAELSEFLGIRTNNYAEYSGLLASLQYALDHGHRRLRVISDSELMVKQIQGKYKVNSPDLKPLWQEAKNRIAKLDGFEITHALRHKNKAADALANQAMDRGMRRGPDTNPVTARPAVTNVGSSAVPRANPYPTRSEAPPTPKSFEPKADPMLRGFTRDGVVHILGGATLPDGIFVKIIRE